MVSDSSQVHDSPLALWLLGVAVAAPPLLAVNPPPSPTLLNQCAAVGLWGASVTALSASRRATAPAALRDAAAPTLALCLTVVAVALSATQGLPTSIAAGLVAVVLGASIVLVAGAEQSARGNRCAIEVFLGALLVAGSINAAIGCIQVISPEWPDGNWIARSGMVGRAVGNLRQPNHLGTLLLWALIALVALSSLGKLRNGVTWALGLLLLLAVVLTGSRTGLLGVAVLAAWGVLDRRLPRRNRMALMTAPLWLAALWVAIAAWAHVTGHAFGSEGRLSWGHGDISSSRFAIWSNALSMIGNDPWTGVGFGEFNAAWTLTAFPDRPIAFFDHTHNLPLQLLVEMGLPLGALVIALLLVALIQAGRRAWGCDGDEGVVRRAAFMVVLMIGVHSMLEYPLWYSYFLLPTAFALGYALSRAPALRRTPDSGPGVFRSSLSAAPESPRRTLAFAGLAMTLGAAAAVLDYWRVVVIYDPPEDAAPLEQRIERGQRSPLFGHHADYAAATAFGEPKAPLSPSQQLAFRRAPHQLLDVRLMIAWSQALAAQGELDKARWLAARIREFRNPGADDFFGPCQQPQLAASAFQCQPPQREVNWREFTEPR